MKNFINNEKIPPIILFISSFILYCLLGYFFLQKYPDYKFHISGYDNFLVNIIKDPMHYAYATIRHPLLSLYMLPLHIVYCILQSNYFIMCIVAGLTAGANFYMYLILTKIVGINKIEATILTLLFISFGYILLMGITLESYPFSLFLLIYSLYYIGLRIKQNIPIKIKQYIILFFLTAGVTLTNGLKIIVAIIFEHFSFKKKFLWALYISITFLIAIIPVYVGTKLFINKANETSSSANPVQIISSKQSINEKTNTSKQPGFLDFIDFNTPFIPAVIHNFIEEPIIYHDSKLDTRNSNLQNNIILTNYSKPFHFIIPIGLFLISMFSLIISFRNNFVQYLAYFYAIDILIHIVFRFGLNEAYIFAPHWIMIIPILIGFFLKKLPIRFRRIVTFAFTILSLYLLIENVQMLSSYLLS